MDKMNVLLIGLGNMGFGNDLEGTGNEHKVISYAKALKEREDLFDVYIYDKDKSKIAQAVDVYNFKSCAKGLKVDIVIIATPDDTHAGELLEVLRYKHKPKLVICEKPLCQTYKQAKEIVKMYEEKNIPLLVDYTRRFIPEIRELKEMYENGILGELKLMKLQFNRGLLHTGTHALDFMIWFTEKTLFNYSDCELINFGSIENYRIWNIQMYFENTYWQEQRTCNAPVNSRYDFHTRYVLNNAINFLNGKEQLYCTGRDALESLKMMEEIRYGV